MATITKKLDCSCTVLVDDLDSNRELMDEAIEKTTQNHNHDEYMKQFKLTNK